MANEKMFDGGGSGATEYMQSLMGKSAPSGDVAAFMAPGNSDSGSENDLANAPSTSAHTPVVTGRKLS